MGKVIDTLKLILMVPLFIVCTLIGLVVEKVQTWFRKRKGE